MAKVHVGDALIDIKHNLLDNRLETELLISLARWSSHPPEEQKIRVRIPFVSTFWRTVAVLVYKLT
jgi:hypothetical protein